VVEFLRDLGIAVVGGIIAGLLSPAVIFLVRERHRQGQEVRMLRAFVTLSKGRLDIPILERKAADQAKIHDYVPVVERIRRKEEILDHPSNPGYYVLTAEGRERASKRSWWRFWG
jgi:hypothetical protein